jgi:hypothetical protein
VGWTEALAILTILQYPVRVALSILAGITACRRSTGAAASAIATRTGLRIRAGIRDFSARLGARPAVLLDEGIAGMRRAVTAIEAMLSEGAQLLCNGDLEA